MQRPIGITILAVLAAIGGVLGLLASVAVMGIGSFGVLAGLIGLAYSLLSLALAYGFWTLQPWAWPLGVGVEVLGIVQALLQFVNGGSNVAGLVITLAIAAFILWYLFQPHVRAAFNR